MIEQEAAIRQWLDGEAAGPGYRSVVNIPVVVHVVWNTNPENVSNEQILSQIEALNRDFRAMDPGIDEVPAVFQDDIGDVEFEFCLASIDPAGNATTGITRTYTDNPVGIGGTSAVYHSGQGGADAWDPNLYLNIWVAKFSGNIGGISSFPGTGDPFEDGVVVNYLQFGTINTAPPYHLGHTCTHEIGHYFNLEHVWGPSILSCCDEDDFVADTPNACETYLNTCPVHPVVSCSVPDMFMNYMFYTEDACMAMFSKGQKDRMRAALNLFRPGLLDSDKCGTVATTHREETAHLTLLQNPIAHGELSFELASPAPGRWKAQVLNAFGQCVYLQAIEPNATVVFPIGPVTAGVYWLELSNGRERIGERFLVP